MSWLPKRDKLDPVQASAIDFVVAQEGNFYINGEGRWLVSKMEKRGLTSRLDF